MHSIIIVIMSIGLFAAFLLAGINYINIEYFDTIKKENEINSRFNNMHSAFLTYENLKGFKLPETDWQNEIRVNTNYYISDIKDEYNWVYSQHTNGYFLCLTSETLSKKTFNASKNIKQDRENVDIGEECGSEKTIEENNFPKKVAITYWLQKEEK